MPFAPVADLTGPFDALGAEREVAASFLDPMGSGRAVVPATEVPAHPGRPDEGGAEVAGRCPAALPGPIRDHRKLGFGEPHSGFEPRRLAPEQGQTDRLRTHAGRSPFDAFLRALSPVSPSQPDWRMQKNSSMRPRRSEKPTTSRA